MIGVVTDSTATLPGELLEKYGIAVAPLHINWDGVRYRDGIDIQPDEFYHRLRTSASLPSTSGAIQGEFIKIFEGMRDIADGIVTIVVSSEFSAAYNAAIVARDMVPGIPVEVIDSRISTMGMGFAAIAAAKAAAAGGDMAQVAGEARERISKVKILFILDTLDYLRRGGRVNFPAAVFASLLQVKPILTLRNGKVESAARPRTREKAIKALLDLIEDNVTSSPLHMSIMHGDDPDGWEFLKNEIESRFNCAELVKTIFTPVMGAHTGPGILGVAFYNE